MADRNDVPTEIEKVGGEPNWLETYVETDSSLEDLKDYRILSRLKVVQAMSDEALKEEFGEGAVIISPGNVLVAEKRTAFQIVPVFFWTEFCFWSDRKDTVSNTILDRSFDKAGDLARKARDPDHREEEYQEGFVGRYVEHLNFASYVYGDHPQRGTALVASFSRGEFGTGRNFISSISLRKVGGKPAPLWAQVWEFKTGFRDQGDKKWYGLDFSNPTTPAEPYIQQSEVEFFLAEHGSCKEDYERSRLLVDHGGDDGGPEDPAVEM